MIKSNEACKIKALMSEFKKLYKILRRTCYGYRKNLLKKSIKPI